MKSLNKTNKLSLSISILACLAAPVSHAAEWDELPADPEVKTYNEGNWGMGSGAVAGAMVGGPAGFVVGAIAGKLIGRHEGMERDIKDSQSQLAKLQAELNNKNKTIASLHQKQANIKQSMMVASLTDVSMQSSSNLEKFLKEKFVFTINFKTNNDQIESYLVEQCRSLAQSLKKLPQLTINLRGFADTRGDNAYNLSLSKRRVNSVKQLLVQEGILESAITVIANGEDGSLNLGDNSDGFSFDRRVVITLSAREVQS